MYTVLGRANHKMTKCRKREEYINAKRGTDEWIRKCWLCWSSFQLLLGSQHTTILELINPSIPAIHFFNIFFWAYFNWVSVACKKKKYSMKLSNKLFEGKKNTTEKCNITNKKQSKAFWQKEKTREGNRIQSPVSEFRYNCFKPCQKCDFAFIN